MCIGTEYLDIMDAWGLVKHSSVDKELSACVCGAGIQKTLRSNFLTALKELQRHGPGCVLRHPNKHKRIEGEDLYRVAIGKGKKNIRLIYGVHDEKLMVLLLVVFEEGDRGDYKKAIRTARDRFKGLKCEYIERDG